MMSHDRWSVMMDNFHFSASKMPAWIIRAWADQERSWQRKHSQEEASSPPLTINPRNFNLWLFAKLAGMVKDPRCLDTEVLLTLLSPQVMGTSNNSRESLPSTDEAAASNSTNVPQRLA